MTTPRRRPSSSWPVMQITFTRLSIQADEVPILLALYLPWPAKCHLHATGDGSQLQSFQIRRSRQPQKILLEFFAAGLPISMNTSTFGLIVYDGTILVGIMSTITCQNAIAETFAVASNKNPWSKVGVVPSPTQR